MSNTWTIMFIVFLLIIISVLSFELGITGVTGASTLNVTDEASALEGSGSVWNSIGYFFSIAFSFWQIMTFQTSLPAILNAFFMIPMTFGIFFIIVTIIRGGAR